MPPSNISYFPMGRKEDGWKVSLKFYEVLGQIPRNLGKAEKVRGNSCWNGSFYGMMKKMGTIL